jgi:hypothetical protein
MSVKAPGKWSRVGTNLVKWLVFCVIAAVIPLICDSLITYYHHHTWIPWKLFGRGQLLLISVALTGTGLGELLFCGKEKHGMRITAGCLCFILLFFSALVYPLSTEDHSPANSSPTAGTADKGAEKPPTDPPNEANDPDGNFMLLISVIVFVGSVVSGALTVIAVEL